MVKYWLIVCIECKDNKVTVLQLSYVQLLLDLEIKLVVSLHPEFTIHLFKAGGLLQGVGIEITILNSIRTFNLPSTITTTGTRDALYQQ